MSSRSRSPRARKRQRPDRHCSGSPRRRTEAEDDSTPRSSAQKASAEVGRGGADQRPSGGSTEEHKTGKSDKADKKDKKEKKELKKAKKRAKKEKKKAKKEAKKAKKMAREEAKRAKEGGKKAKGKKRKASSSSSSSDSSSSSSLDSSLGLNFVLDKDFGRSGEQMDPRNPDRKIQKALGLTCGAFSFIDRDDDQKVAHENGYGGKFSDGKVVEDRTKDWICQRSKANGDPCGARNFMRNEYCITCGALKPRSAVLQSRDVKGTKLDGYKYR